MQALNEDQQLLHDMDVHWSSTYFMIKHALELEGPFMDMILLAEFSDLHKYVLTEDNWDALVLCHAILHVRSTLI